VAVLLAAPAHANGPDSAPAPLGERALTVLNQGVRAINELYVSPQTAEQWGEDWLGERMLEPGAVFRVRLGRTRTCVFDVKIIYDDASREEQLARSLEMIANTAPLDVSGHPAISVPAGLADGLPVGMMIVGRHFEDATCLRVAQAYETAVGGFPAPPSR